MMFRLKIEVIEQRPPDIARDAWRDICRRAFAATASYWYRNFFPKHFLPSARHRYQHKLRGKAYDDFKEKLAARGYVALGGRVDNVFTGRMMRELLARSIIRGFPTRGRVEMFGPDYLRINFRTKPRADGKKPMDQPNKKRELTTLHPSEREVLLQFLLAFVYREFKRYRGRRSRKKY